MQTETQKDLNDETIEAIQDLIQANIDSSQGFSEAAKEIEDTNLASLFMDLSQQRHQLAATLRQHVQVSGVRPRTEGTWLASFHRTWIDLRGKLSGGDSHVILCEAERGEDHIKQAYEDVLKKTAGSAMNDVLTNQYATIKEGHDRIRDLRDQ